PSESAPRRSPGGYLLMLPSPPPSPLFPYTTLFRSHGFRLRHLERRAVHDSEHERGELVAIGVGLLRDRAHGGLIVVLEPAANRIDRKSTRLNSSHRTTSYAVFCLKTKKDGHEPGNH